MRSEVTPPNPPLSVLSRVPVGYVNGIDIASIFVDPTKSGIAVIDGGGEWILWHLSIVDHNNDRVKNFCKMSPCRVIVIYFANDLVATAIIHYRAYDIGGGSQKTSSNSAIIDPDLDMITTDLRRTRRHSAMNLRENQPRPIGCQLAEWEFFCTSCLPT